ncbi:hypothetical protein AB6A40_006405 [Gnathostoma spinigerum]|uniref:Uncharacterized protein n=1 Tax=Gnathostoma spinigerum TaxID=75299 RepID=A0ABD6EKD4_9BILA
MSDSWRSFYSLCSDLVSLLTIVACVLRLPIYCASNLKIRNEVLENFYRLISYKKGYNRLYLRKRQTRCNETMRYCNSENGFVVPQSNADGTKSKCVGTLFDKIALSVALSSNLRKNDNEFGEEVDDEMEDEDDGMRKENEEKAKKSTFL